jgi:hypothetical protein
MKRIPLPVVIAVVTICWLSFAWLAIMAAMLL